MKETIQANMKIIEKNYQTLFYKPYLDEIQDSIKENIPLSAETKLNILTRASVLYYVTYSDQFRKEKPQLMCPWHIISSLLMCIKKQDIENLLTYIPHKILNKEGENLDINKN